MLIFCNFITYADTYKKYIIIQYWFTIITLSYLNFASYSLLNIMLFALSLVIQVNLVHLC